MCSLDPDYLSNRNRCSAMYKHLLHTFCPNRPLASDQPIHKTQKQLQIFELFSNSNLKKKNTSNTTQKSIDHHHTCNRHMGLTLVFLFPHFSFPSSFLIFPFSLLFFPFSLHFFFFLLNFAFPPSLPTSIPHMLFGFVIRSHIERDIHIYRESESERHGCH